MALMEEDPDHVFNHPIIVTLDQWTYGDRAGEKIHVQAMCYSLLGPVVNFPGRVFDAGNAAKMHPQERSEAQSGGVVSRPEEIPEQTLVEDISSESST